MKTIRLIPVFLFCIAVIMSACKKEANTIDPNQPPIAEIKATIMPPNPGYDSAVTISWDVNGTCSTFLAYYFDGVKNDTIGRTCSGSYKFTHIKSQINVTLECLLVKNGRMETKVYTINPGSAPIPPVLTVTYDTSTVVYGGSKVVSWSASANTDSVVDSKNHNVGNSGSIQLGGLEKDTTLLRKAINGAGFDAKLITIKVASKPVKTTADKFNGSWLNTDILYRIKDSTTFKSIIVDCQKDDIWKFMKDLSDTTKGTFEMHQGLNWCYGTNEIWWYGGWFLVSNNTQIIIGGTTFDILELTDTKLVMTDIDIGMGGTFKYVFSKQTQKK